MGKTKETGLLLQISKDGTSIRVLHKMIERHQAQVRIQEMAKDGVEAKYFAEKTVGEFEKVVDKLNENLKRHKQPTVRILHKAV